MPTETQVLFTAGVMAKELGIADAKVKKAIKDLKLEPAAKKGCCSYYTQADLERLKGSIQ
jgi:hypothetical protein